MSPSQWTGVCLIRLKKWLNWKKKQGSRGDKGMGKPLPYYVAYLTKAFESHISPKAQVMNFHLPWI